MDLQAFWHASKGYLWRLPNCDLEHINGAGFEMADNEKIQTELRCAVCGHTWLDPLLPDGSVPKHCPECQTIGQIERRKVTFSVSGRSSTDVEQVTTALIKAARSEIEPLRRNPWVSGSFYLAVFAIVASLFLAIAQVVPPLAVPIVIIGAILGVSIIGAFQLRFDESLSERSFLELMALTFRQLPFIGKGKGPQASKIPVSKARAKQIEKDAAKNL